MYAIRIILFALAVSFCQFTHGQIKCEKNYPAYSLIEFDVTTPVESTFRHVIWKFEPAKISGKQMADGQMIFTAPPGSYRVLASVLYGTKDGEKITVEQTGHQLWESTFTIGEGVDPPPDDDDDIDTPPVPITTVPAMVLVVEESSQRTAETAILLADASYWATVVDRGMRWRVYDIDSLGPTQAAWSTAAKTAGLPAMLIVDASNTVIAAAKLPATKTDIDAAIKKAGGK